MNVFNNTRDMLNSVVVKYIISLRHFCDQCDDAYQFESELNAAKLVLDDAKDLQDFFSKHAEKLKKGGLRGEIDEALDEEFKPIRKLARVIGANHMSAVKEDIEFFFQRFGDDGLYIVKSAIKLNPAMDKSQKKENDAFVMKTYTKELSTTEAIAGAISNIFKSADLMIGSMNKKKHTKKKQKATKLSSYFKRS